MHKNKHSHIHARMHMPTRKRPCALCWHEQRRRAASAAALHGLAPAGAQEALARTARRRRGEVPPRGEPRVPRRPAPTAGLALGARRVGSEFEGSSWAGCAASSHQPNLGSKQLNLGSDRPLWGSCRTISGLLRLKFSLVPTEIGLASTNFGFDLTRSGLRSSSLDRLAQCRARLGRVGSPDPAGPAQTLAILHVKVLPPGPCCALGGRPSRCTA